MKKCFALILAVMMLMSFSLTCLAETALSENARLIYETIRWNVNLPKTAMVQHAEEYLFKLTDEITLHALLMEITISEELEMMYGTGGRIVVIDLDTGEVIDYKNFDGNVLWPVEGEVTSKYDALHLMYNSYWSCLDGYNDRIMSDFEFLTPIPDEEIAAINAALTSCFIR
ncbi:MAG: hypothetical protein IKK75_14210 [Clostridia bacterium]|nr:hypothetical protein [Clostridia bacterium]